MKSPTLSFNPFDRRTSALPPPVRVVASVLNDHTRRYEVELAVSNTGAGLNAMAQNYYIGAMVNIQGVSLVVTAVGAAQSHQMDHPGDVQITIEAMTPAELMNFAATGSAKIQKDAEGKPVVQVPRRHFSGTRKLIA